MNGMTGRSGKIRCKISKKNVSLKGQRDVFFSNLIEKDFII